MSNEAILERAAVLPLDTPHLQLLIAIPGFFSKDIDVSKTFILQVAHHGCHYHVHISHEESLWRVKAKLSTAIGLPALQQAWIQSRMPMENIKVKHLANPLHPSLIEVEMVPMPGAVDPLLMEADKMFSADSLGQHLGLCL